MADREVRMDPNRIPVVTILHSAEPDMEGKKMSLPEAEETFQRLSGLRSRQRKEMGLFERIRESFTQGRSIEQDERRGMTAFRIDYTLNGERKTYEGQLAFGDGDGSLTEHLCKLNQGIEMNESFISRKELTDYLNAHLNLVHVETDQKYLRSKYMDEPDIVASCNAMIEQVEISRDKLNRGGYPLEAFPNNPSGVERLVDDERRKRAGLPSREEERKEGQRRFLEEKEAERLAVLEYKSDFNVGRIDYHSPNGKVVESIEYRDPVKFMKRIQEDVYYGVPMEMIVYKDPSTGKHMPLKWLNQLDPGVAWKFETANTKVSEIDVGGRLQQRADHVIGQMGKGNAVMTRPRGIEM